MHPQGPLLRGRPERPASLGDVRSGRVARTVVADGFEAKDEAKGTNETVGQALMQSEDRYQLTGDRLQIRPAAGWEASYRSMGFPVTDLRSFPCPSVIAGAVPASPPRMRAV